MGLRGSNFLQSYLMIGQQYICSGSVYPNFSEVDYEERHGSVLGPFFVYINEIDDYCSQNS